MGNIQKFDAIANQYDTVERVEISKIIANTIKRYITNSKNKVFIDFGCGTGLVGMELLEEFKSMIFMDASNNMIECVKEKIGKLQILDAKTICVDIEADCNINMKVDYIFIVQTLLHKEIINRSGWYEKIKKNAR